MDTSTVGTTASKGSDRWGPGRVARMAALALVPAVLLATPFAVARDDDTSAAPVRDTVPPRALDASSVRMTDEALWSQIDASGGMAVVGLKAPDRNRGVWRDEVLVDAEDTRRAERAVLARPGVSVVSRPGDLPTMSVKVADADALAGLRRLPTVDYVEPLYARLEPQSGCKQVDYALANMSDADKQDWYRQTASPTTPAGDWVPWNFDSTKVRSAWSRANGDDVTIGVIDTGVYPEQPQLSDAEFQAGDSGDRTLRKYGADRSWEWGYNPTAEDRCGHGTRMAGTIAAPRDGRNMVGVAWKANLVIERAGDDVVLGMNNQWDVANAIDRIAWLGAPRTIVAMAFGRYGELSTVADAIRRHPGVLFVAAAGSRVSSSSSGGCIEGWTYFPATMPEVVAASGTEPGRSSISRQACAGREVDIAPVIGEVPATGQDPGDLWLFGGSSDGTAVTAGIAALIWQTYPHFSVADVRTRLLRTADGTGDPFLGAGNPNAYKAVGGFTGMYVSGPSSVNPGATYTLTARPTGDGPFAYRWSTGETTPSITRRAGTTASGSQTVSVTVTDTRENKPLAASKTVTWPIPEAEPIDPPTCLRCSTP